MSKLQWDSQGPLVQRCRPNSITDDIDPLEILPTLVHHNLNTLAVISQKHCNFDDPMSPVLGTLPHVSSITSHIVMDSSKSTRS